MLKKHKNTFFYLEEVTTLEEVETDEDVDTEVDGEMLEFKRIVLLHMV